MTAAELYIDLGNYKIAEKYLNKLEKKFQNKSEFIQIRRNKSYTKYDDAIEYFSSAISQAKITDEKTGIYFIKGMSYERSSKWDLAEKFLYALELSLINRLL